MLKTLKLDDSKLSIGYIAGFFDGEGHITINIDGGAGIFFTNTNLEVLKEIRSFLGTGRIYSWNPQKPNHRTKHTLHISTLEETLSLAEKLLQICIVKKADLEHLISYIRHHLKERNEKNEQIRKESCEALKLYRSGLSIAEVSRCLNIPYYRLRYRLQRENGYKAHSRSEVLRLAWLRRRECTYKITVKGIDNVEEEKKNESKTEIS